MINGQRVGYTRVSTLEQNTDRQLDGIELDRTFADHVSGKDLHRPQLCSCRRQVAVFCLRYVAGFGRQRFALMPMSRCARPDALLPLVAGPHGVVRPLVRDLGARSGVSGH
jgi:hypothetical protein